MTTAEPDLPRPLAGAPPTSPLSTGPLPTASARTLRGRLVPVTALLAAVRPRQWLKNALVIGAPIAAGRELEPAVMRTTAIAFVAFCLAASGAYLLNDVHDAVEDRLHPVKRHRPVASGDLGVRSALVASALLGLACVAVARLASTTFVALVVAYLVVTVSYTMRLRNEPILDLVAVALGFVLRGAAGGVAAGIPISSWFLVVAGFGALFLVSGKRYSELVSRSDVVGRRAALATYSPSFLRFVWTTAATVTVTAYALWASEVYLVRDEGSWALWSLVPFLLALLRYALEVDRGATEAPEEVLLGSRLLQVLGLAWIVMLVVGAGGTD